MALLHQVVPGLSAGLDQLGPVPDVVRRLIQDYTAAVRRYGVAVREELLTCVESWTSVNLEFLILPNWMEDKHALPTPAYVEVFVRHSHLQRFLQELDAQGFRRVWPARISRNFVATETHLLFQAEDGRAIFSLRWRLPGRTSGVHSLEETWRRRELRTWLGRRIFVPCAADLLLLSVMLGAENHWRRLPDLLSVCEAARQLPAQQWNSLLAQAAAAGTRTNVLLGLELAVAAGKVHVPDEVLSAMRSANLRGRARSLLAGLFSMRSGAETLYDLRWDLSLLDSPVRQVRHLIRFLFTPTLADVGSGSWFAPVLRPARLLLALAGIPIGSAAKKLASPAEVLSAYRPSEMTAVDRMLEMAKVTKQDVVYDLGCGDGRILIRAAEKCGARGVGIDLDPQRIAEARENAQSRGVQHLVHFRVSGLQQEDFREATALMLYLPPAVHLELGATFAKRLRPGARVVSHGSDTGVWEQAEVVERAGYPMAVFLRTIAGSD